MAKVCLWFEWQNLQILFTILGKFVSWGFFFNLILFFWDAEDKEKVSEMEADAETASFSNRISSVVSRLTEIESLIKAFDGCAGVFHTTAFVDPAGISGYSVCTSISISSSIPIYTYTYICTTHTHKYIYVCIRNGDTYTHSCIRTKTPLGRYVHSSLIKVFQTFPFPLWLYLKGFAITTKFLCIQIKNKKIRY